MLAPRGPGKFKRNIRIDCGKYLLRTIGPDDASERWVSWASDPSAMETLNLPARKLNKGDIAAYIRGFEQWSHLLLGIFEKHSWSHIGIIRVDVDYATGRAHLSALIGESEYRNKGATADVFVLFLTYLFDTVGLSKMTTSVLSRNQLTIGYLLKVGWRVEGIRTRTRSPSGKTLDVKMVTLTREAWEAQKTTAMVSRVLRRVRANRETLREPRR